MFKRRKLKFRNNYELSLIACGDTGEQLGIGIIQNLKERGASVKSLLVTSGRIDERENSVFTKRFSVDLKHDGFAKKLEFSRKEIIKRKKELMDAIEEIKPNNPNELLIVTTGAGATGLGSTLEILEILHTEHHLIPPVFTLLPEVFENSRVQNNTAQFLYELVYKKHNRGNAVIVLDNKPSFKELELPFSEISKKRLQMIPNAIGDMLFGSFQSTQIEKYDATEKDLHETIHVPGISVFVVEELQNKEGDSSSRLDAIISDSVIKTTSLSREQVFEAKRAYISISNIDHAGEEKLSFQTSFEADKLSKEFIHYQPYIKFISTHEKEKDVDVEETSMLHAIIAGLPQPPRIIQIMQLGRDARKDVIFKEYQLNHMQLDFSPDTINELTQRLSDKFNQNT